MMNLRLFIPAPVCGLMGLGMRAYKPEYTGSWAWVAGMG